MFNEEVKYIEGLPVGIFSANVQSEYYHWHYDLEIILVLKGFLTVRIGPDVYKLKEDDLIFIDPEDIHKIESESDNNLVLFLHLDVDKFEEIYPNISYMFFTCENLNINSIMKQEILKEKVEWLKLYMCQIMYEKMKKEKGYLERIKEITNECVLLLINEFRTLQVDENPTKKDNNCRIYSILRYMYDYYYENITLQEIAQRVYLSKYYVSHLIKEYIGLSFRDMLHYIRVEEATKLMISTDKTITEITYDVGFSRIKYFNDSFEKLYGCRPANYRKKEQNVNITRADMKKYKNYQSDYLESLLLKYLGEIPKEELDYQCEKVHKVITVDVLKTGLKYKAMFQNAIIIDDIKKLLLLFDNEDVINDLKEINCDTVILSDLVMDWKSEKIAEELYFKQYIVDKLEKCYKYNITLVLQMTELSENCRDILFKNLNFLKDKGYEYIFKNIKINKYPFTHDEINTFAKSLKKSLGYDFDIENIIICIDLGKNKTNQNTYNVENTLKYLLDNYYNGYNGVYYGFGDEFGKSNRNIIFNNKLKSSGYYMYYLLSCLKGEIIQKGEEYVITQEGKNINVLMYNLDKEKQQSKKKILLSIKGLKGVYRYIRYTMSDKTCYDYWNELGRPIPIKKHYCDLINAKTFPSIQFKTLDVTGKERLQIILDLDCISLIVLEKI